VRKMETNQLTLEDIEINNIFTNGSFSVILTKDFGKFGDLRLDYYPSNGFVYASGFSEKQYLLDFLKSNNFVLKTVSHLGFTAQDIVDWEKFEDVRFSEEFNMFSKQAKSATGLNDERYNFVMRNYSQLKAAVQYLQYTSQEQINE